MQCSSHDLEQGSCQTPPSTGARGATRYASTGGLRWVNLSKRFRLTKFGTGHDAPAWAGVRGRFVRSCFVRRWMEPLGETQPRIETARALEERTPSVLPESRVASPGNTQPARAPLLRDRSVAPRQTRSLGAPPRRSQRPPLGLLPARPWRIEWVQMTHIV